MKPKRGQPCDGEANKRLRDKKGLTQEELAERAGLKVAEIRRAEAGGNKMPEQLQQIALALTDSIDFDSIILKPQEAIHPTILKFARLLAAAVEGGWPNEITWRLRENQIIIIGAFDVKMSEGSVIIEMSLTKGDALRLTQAFLDGRLMEYSCNEVAFPSDRFIDTLHLFLQEHPVETSFQGVARDATSGIGIEIDSSIFILGPIDFGSGVRAGDVLLMKVTYVNPEKTRVLIDYVKYTKHSAPSDVMSFRLTSDFIQASHSLPPH